MVPSTFVIGCLLPLPHSDFVSSAKRALVRFSSSCNKGPIGNLGIGLLGDQMVAGLMAVGGDFWLSQFQLHLAIKLL